MVCGVATQFFPQRRSARGRSARSSLSRRCACGMRQTGRRRSQRGRQISSHARLTVLDPLGQRHRPDRRRRAGVVGRRNPSRPAMFGQHQRPRVVAVTGRLQHHGQPAATALGDGDDVAAAQRGQRVVGRLASLQPRRARLGPFPFGDLRAQPRVVQDRRVAVRRARRRSRRASSRRARCRGPTRPPTGRPDTARTTAPAACAPVPGPSDAPD